MYRIEHTVLIDDNKTTNFLNKYLMLKSKRFKSIETFINGKAVLEKFSTDISFKPDLILLDIDMPGISGWELLEKFEKRYAKKVKTKIFILTSAINQENLNKFKSNYFVPEYLVKPLSIDIIETLYNKHFQVKGSIDS